MQRLLQSAIDQLYQGRYPEALVLISELESSGGELEPQGFLAKGLCQFRLGRFDEAAITLEKARAGVPGLPVARIFEARALIELGELQKATELIDGISQPLRLPPDQANEFALACIGIQDFSRAESVIVNALAKAPEDLFLLANLALIHERGNRIEEALRTLDGIKHPEPQVELLQIRLQIRSGQDEQGLSSLDRLSAKIEVDQRLRPLLAQLEFERGQLLDRLGRHGEAFAAFVRGNAIDREAWDIMEGRTNIPQGGSSGLKDDPEFDPKPANRDLCPVEHTPIFLVGFPRSGTTLLDQMLDAHPALQVLDEQLTLGGVVKHLRRMPDGFPDALRNLSGQDVNELRDAYWSVVERYVELRPDSTLVDKQPLNMTQAQLICHIFPRAKWIYLLRHPYDVILSCFMQRFHYTAATQGFWDLREIAKNYIETTELWLRQRRRLGLDCIDIRYEELVADPSEQGRRLCKHLGLEWRANMSETHAHARSRWVRTPSYHQVAQPVYRRAAGRWRSYRPWLEPIGEILQPMVEKLGYDIA